MIDNLKNIATAARVAQAVVAQQVVSNVKSDWNGNREAIALIQQEGGKVLAVARNEGASLIGAARDAQATVAGKVMANAKDAWSRNREALALIQEEGRKLIGIARSEGAKVVSQARNVQRGSLGEAAQGARARVEQLFQERVRQSLNRLDVPSRQDVEALADRVDAIATKVDALSAKAGVAARRRRSAKSVGV